MKMGAYEAQSNGKRGFFRIEKMVATPEGLKPVIRFVPMESVIVTLTHKSGDTVTIRKTKMGKAGRTSFTRCDNLPKGLTVTKLATGPDLVEIPKGARGMTEQQAKADIVRMTGCNPDDADTLLDFDGLLAAAQG